MVKELYDRSGELDVFFALKPILTYRQTGLIAAFNTLSQERELSQSTLAPIKDMHIHYYQRYNGSLGYAPDLFVFAINDLDQDYTNRRFEELKRKANKGK